jgi:type II secretory pathway pseudopilin PulG
MKQSKQNPNGFALIATILLMVLLAIITVGTLSLSVVTLRSNGQESAQNIARANARMALMIAIGELQRHTGSDTRVTAPANIVDENYPQVLGVWKSWEGTDHEANGRPIAPLYDSKDTPESSGGRFIDWLVSSASSNPTPAIGDAPSLVQATRTSDNIPLLAEGSLQDADTRQIHVVPTLMDDDGDDESDGRFAWWISGENQKAMLAQPYEPRTDDAAGLVEMGQSHSVANPAVFGFPSLITDPELHNPSAAPTKAGRKAVSRQSMALIVAGNTTEPQKKFHDLSAYSIGLLTNTATGGWRKDMSILTERWDNIYASYPGGQLPLFRYSPVAGNTSLVPKPGKPAAATLATNAGSVIATCPPLSNLYPWSDYSLILGQTQPGTYHAASASWASLQSFATSYKGFSNSSGDVTSPFVWDAIAKRAANSVRTLEIYNHKHSQRLHPQIARFQLIVYARAIVDPGWNGVPPTRYQVQMMYVPFFTLWNPYNVTLEHTISGTTVLGGLPEAQRLTRSGNFLGFGTLRSLPGAMAIVNKAAYPNPDTVPISQYRLLMRGNIQYMDATGFPNPQWFEPRIPENILKFGHQLEWIDMRQWACWLPEGTMTFKPGEAKIYSVDYADTGYSQGAFRLKEGYDPNSILGTRFNYQSNLLGSTNFWFLFRNDRFTKPYLGRIPGHGFSLNIGKGGGHFGGTSGLPSSIGDELHNVTSLASSSDGDKYWPPVEIDEVGYSVAELASAPWTPLYSMNFGPRMTIGTAPGTVQNRPTKGVLQNNALAGMVLSDPSTGAAKDHPANNTFDFAYQTVSAGSTITPNLSASAGYIATGHQSGDGLKRLIAVEIPRRPMSSLIELQGWNPKGQNPYPPFQMNLIGNSDATPLIPMGSIVPPTLSPNSVSTNLQHDDAYCANHLLFDDWFLSSIAPEPETSKDINTIYTEFLKGDRKLTNRNYSPISADNKVTDGVATTRLGEVITSNDGWLKVASRFEVEGMFNVNSTSVDAWRALLGHARSLDKIAMHGANGIVETDTSGKHAVTRGAIATDVEAGTNPSLAGPFNNASEYTGFRSLSDEQITDLAEKVVEQVRLRGPFLSLSEFVNRQLSSNTDLALAGAIQSAINNLTEDPMAELRDPNNSLSAKTMLPTDPKLDGAGYEFNEAAEGDSAYGAPGWIRQADILRPIAPVLSVRDDTFTIRAYGDALDKNGRVIAQAWCEATVKRTREFSDQTDAADSIDPPTVPINITYGRRYDLVSFRWLNSDEV